MKFRIAGYGGQHEEAGARIEDEAGNRVLTTPSLKGNTPALWKAYHDNNTMILNALNGHQPMLDALRLVDRVIHSAIPEPGAPHDEACKAVRSSMIIAEGLMWGFSLIKGEWCVVDISTGEAQVCDSMDMAKAETKRLNDIYRRS